MSTRKATIEKFQQLPESLLQEVEDFIDFIVHKHQAETASTSSVEKTVGAWADWFEAVDRLEVVSTPEPNSSYQQNLLNKYRQQGLDL
jgi:hypothetical protein